MIHFINKPPLENPDIELSKVKSLSHLTELVQNVIEKRQKNEQIIVALLPPIARNISMPLSFKVIMSFMKKLKAKSLSVIFYTQSDEIKDHLYKYLPIELRPTAEYKIGKVMIILKVADIVEAKTEAIVNASNQNLKLGGGVSGSIKKVANSDLQIILNKLAIDNPLQEGDAVLTDGFGIPGIKYIIHVAAVTGTKEVLQISLVKIFRLCEQHAIASVAIPALGTGVGGLDIKTCAEVFFKEMNIYFSNNPDTAINRVEIILWKNSDYDSFKAIKNIFFSKHTNITSN